MPFSDIILPIALTAGLTLVILAFALWRVRREAAMQTWLAKVVADQGGAHLHIFAARRVMPDEGESYDIFTHFVFNVPQRRIYKGESLQGESLGLKSPFVKRSLDALSLRLNEPLALGDEVEDDLEHEPDGFALIFQKARRSDTEDPLAPPFIQQGLTFTRSTTQRGDDTFNHFTLGVWREGAEVATHRFDGDDTCSRTVYRWRDRRCCAFTYRRQHKGLDGMALALIDEESGALLFHDFIQETPPPKG